MSTRPPSTGISSPAILPEAVAVIALLAVPVSLLVGTRGVVTNPDALGPIVATTVLAHLTAAGARRCGAPSWLALTAHTALGSFVVTFVALRDTAIASFIPTLASADRAASEVASAMRDLRSAVPPVELAPGVAIAAMATLWLLAAFADAAAFRLVAPAQALVPYLGSALFLAAAYEGATPLSTRIVAPVAAATFLCAARTRRQSLYHWVQPVGSTSTPTTTVLGRGLAFLALATVACLVAATTLSALQYATPSVSLRDAVAGEPRRQVTTPFVDIGQQLGPRSNDVVMRVTAESPHYWRQTALDEFESTSGRWTASARNYESFDSGDELTSGTVDDTVDIVVENIPNVWLPVPWRTTRIRSDLDLKYDRESGSVIAAVSSPGKGRRAEVEVSTSSPQEQPDGRNPEIQPIQLPRGDRNALDTLLADVGVDQLDPSTGRASDLDRLRTLQDHLRSFEYDTTVDYSVTSTPTAAFLDVQRGFCTQFASTFALAANRMGFASRVATGYTWGEPDPENPGTSVIRGRHAHAWPEVFVPDRGWLAFEPTPGRGNPDSAELTGVDADQDDGPTSTTTTTTATSTTTPEQSTTTSSPTTVAQVGAADQQNPTTPDDPAWVRSAAPPVVAVVIAAVLAGCRVLWIARRRRRAVTHPAGRSAWDEIEELLLRDGHRFAPSATPTEIAHQVDEALASSTAMLHELARLESARRWSATPLRAGDLSRFARSAQSLRAQILARLTYRQRVAHLIGWPIRRVAPPRALAAMRR